MSFTIQSTILLGLVLVFLTYLMYIVLKKLDAKLNSKLLLSLGFWVILASFARVFEDAGIYPEHFFTITPGIILLFASIFIPVLCLGAFIEKKTEFQLWKTLSISAIIGIIPHLFFFKFVNLVGGATILGLFAAVVLIMLLANKFVQAGVYSFWALATHLFDSSTTFVSMQFYGYSEQHLLPAFLIDIFGPWIMFPLKLVFLIPIIYVINKYSEEDYLRKVLLLAIFAIGLAPAIRGLLRLWMGV